MDKYVLAAPIRSYKSITFGLIEEFYRTIPAHEKKAPIQFTVQTEYAAQEDLRQGESETGVCGLIFACKKACENKEV